MPDISREEERKTSPQFVTRSGRAGGNAKAIRLPYQRNPVIATAQTMWMSGQHNDRISA